MRDPLRFHGGDRRELGRLRKNSLRIAIRQLERAELYVVALNSLELDDEAVAQSVDRLVDHLRSLRQYLLSLKATA